MHLTYRKKSKESVMLGYSDKRSNGYGQRGKGRKREQITGAWQGPHPLWASRSEDFNQQIMIWLPRKKSPIERFWVYFTTFTVVPATAWL